MTIQLIIAILALITGIIALVKEIIDKKSIESKISNKFGKLEQKSTGKNSPNLAAGKDINFNTGEKK